MYFSPFHFFPLISKTIGTNCSLNGLMYPIYCFVAKGEVFLSCNLEHPTFGNEVMCSEWYVCIRQVNFFRIISGFTCVWDYKRYLKISDNTVYQQFLVDDLLFWNCTKWPGFLKQQLDPKLRLPAVLIKAILQALPLQSPLINLFSYLALCAWPRNLSESSTYGVNHKPKFGTRNSNQLYLEHNTMWIAHHYIENLFKVIEGVKDTFHTTQNFTETELYNQYTNFKPFSSSMQLRRKFQQDVQSTW